MKTSISSYSYSQLFNDSFTMYDAIRKTREIGLDGFEVAEAGWKPDAELPEFLKKVKETCDAEGLPIPCYTVGGNMLVEDLDAEVERLKRQVDMAVILGAPVMRHDVAYGVPAWHKGAKTFDAVLPRIAEGVRRVTEYAAECGVKTCMENHGFFAQDSERVLKIVTAVNHENYGVLADMGNFTCADERPDIAYGKVIPSAFHVHTKDMFLRSGSLPDPGEGWFKSRGGNYIRCTILGHGDVPVKQCLSLLKQAGYEGYASIEFEGMEPTMKAIEISAANLKRYIAEV
ncbi:MAG: sugar phosphate isomerase/epimerase [Firmicutes bacterium]|nr:sugar phosphate isomerase/epimerase [Bacillota bacterium]